MRDGSVERARRFLRVLYALMAAVATSFYGLLSVILILNVFARNVLEQPLFFGAERVAVICTLLAGNFGLALASASGAHIRPRVADHWVPASWDTAMNRIADLVTAVVMFGVAAYAIDFVYQQYDLEAVLESLYWPAWPIQAAIPLGYMVAGLHYLCFAAFPALRPREEQPTE